MNDDRFTGRADIVGVNNVDFMEGTEEAFRLLRVSMSSLKVDMRRCAV